MGKPPAFSLYAADFYMDTNSWTTAQVGAYFRLLMYEWVNGALPADNASRARIAGTDPRNMQKMWSAVIAKKFTTDDAGMYVNKRLEETREKQKEYQEKQSVKGKKSAEKRCGQLLTTVEPEPQPEVNLSFSSSLSLKDKDKKPASAPPDLELQSVVDNVRKHYPSFHGLYGFIGKHRKDNRAALIHTLNQLIKYHENGTPVKDPYPFCRKIMENENGKYNARDHDKKAQEYKITKGEAQSFKEIFHAKIKGE